METVLWSYLNDWLPVFEIDLSRSFFRSECPPTFVIVGRFGDEGEAGAALVRQEQYRLLLCGRH